MPGALRKTEGLSQDLAEVAQLVERRVVVPNVAGSSPVLRPKLKDRDKSRSFNLAKDLLRGGRHAQLTQLAVKVL